VQACACACQVHVNVGKTIDVGLDMEESRRSEKDASFILIEECFWLEHDVRFYLIICGQSIPPMLSRPDLSTRLCLCIMNVSIPSHSYPLILESHLARNFGLFLPSLPCLSKFLVSLLRLREDPKVLVLPDACASVSRIETRGVWRLRGREFPDMEY
jgi:hypothetical protein